MVEPIEVKEPEAPTLPPPVEYPEYFPGFGREFEQLGVEYYKAQKRATEAQRQLGKVTAPIRWEPSVTRPTFFGYMMPTLPWQKEEAARRDEETRLAQQEYDLALQDLKAVIWRHEVMTTLPNYLAIPDYKVQSAEDILQHIPLDSIRDEDTAWLTSIYDRLKHLSNVLPEGYDEDAIDAQSRILNEILTAPKLELRAVHSLTVDEIAKSFAFGVAELPPRTTVEQVRYMIGKMELADEEMKSAKDWLAIRATEWAVESSRLNLIRAGTILAEAPALTPVEFGKLLLTQPMMATVELLDKYWNILARPMSAMVTAELPPFAAGAAHGIFPGMLAGFVGGALFGALGGPVGAGAGALIGAGAGALGLGTVFALTGDTNKDDVSKLFDYYKGMGETNWASYAMAFNEWEAPWWKKLLLETSFDPIMAIGLGLAPAVATKLGTGLTKIGLRGIGTRIGPLVTSFELGYIRGADAIFKAGIKVFMVPFKGFFWTTAKIPALLGVKGAVEFGIPRTFTQMSRNFARDAYMKFSSVLQRTYPEVRNMKGLTAKDAIDTGINCIDQAIARPMEGWDAAVKAGAPMLEFNYLDNAAALRLSKEIVKDISFDTNRLAHLNHEVLNMFSGQGERLTAGKIISNLGQEATEEMVTKLSTKLVAFRQKIADTAKAALKGDTAEDVLMGMFNRLEGLRYGNLHSPLTKYMEQAGRSASWHSRIADRVLYSAQIVALERRLVIPVARWNLLFANFGPFNYLENMQRSFLGGAEIMYPKSYSGVAETNRLFKGLANAPYDLQMMERGEQRLAQAVIDPKTGRTAVFKGGKVPFITKEVVIPEKIPFLGGKTIGAKINIAGQDHYLASFQDAYDMWAHFNSMQVAYDYQVNYMKALAEVAPDNMESLVKIMAKHKPEIDNIATITAKDARDIERVLLADSTVGPEAVRMHSKLDVLEFERRQISKDLGRTFDKCTDVRMMTKAGIRDEVLDGSIFTDIDGRIAAFTERERELSLISLKNQINVLEKEADAFLANPPRNLDEFLGDMNNITALVEGTGERIHDYRRLTELRKAKLLPGEMDDFEVGSAKLLAEFMETSEEQLVKIMNQLVDNARGLRAKGLIDWETVKFTNIGEHYTPQIKKIIDELPLNIRFSVKTIRFDARLKLFNAKWNPVTKTITIRSPETIGSIPHELGHSASNELIEAGNYSMIDDFAKLWGELPINWAEVRYSAQISRRTMYEEFYRARPKIEEKFASLFNDYAKNLPTVTGNPPIMKFFSEHFPKRVTGMLNDTQLARLTDLDSISRFELENILATRNKIAEIEAIIPRTPKGKRNDRFWLQQRAQKSAIWDEFDKNARKSKSLRLRASRNFLSSVDKPVYVPDYIPEVVDKLTPNHLAYLYGATGDDLYRGLTRIQHHTTIRPREDFILHTVEQADAYAAKLGKTAADIGFTDDAIGEVYDQLWRNLGVEPTILTPDSPTVMQLEEIRQELTRLHGAYKLPGGVNWDAVRFGAGISPQQREATKKLIDDLPFGIKANIKEIRVEEIAGIGQYDANTGIITFGKAELAADPMALYHEVGHSIYNALPEAERTQFILDYTKAAGIERGTRGAERFALDMEESFSREFSRYCRNPELLPKREVKFFESKFPKGGAPDIVKWRQYINGVADDVEKLPQYTTAKADWWTTKESAMTKAREMHALAYPTYDDANIIDESMRAIFPFWNYELFRWRWIPRTAMRTPGTLTGVARWMNYSDQGYIPVPGTDLQMNILRGSVWMGGLRSFYLRDFPEYYDVMPGMELLDYIGRAGFFPGIHVMLPITLFGAAVGKPETGQLLPAWMRTGLSGLRTLSPQHIGAVLEHIYPDRFRDYMVMLTLGEEGYDADEIWKKKTTGVELTPEEEKLWLKAANRVDGIKGILMQQTGLFRIRPQEFSNIRKEMRLAIEEATGVPVSVQEQIDRRYPVTGKRFSDYYKLDVYQQKLLYEWETYRRWQGVTTPLYPSSWQLLDVKTRDYYEELDKVYNEARTVGVYEEDKLIRPSMVEMNRQFVEGEIGPDQWMGFRSDLVGSLAEAVRILGESPAYKDVPKTFEERCKMLEERNIPTPTQTPDQELLYYYYELRPEYKWNWDSQRMERDFDTYYAYIDILLETLDAPHRERLLQRIQADWTPLEKLYWQFSREYARPYRNLRDIVLREYKPEQIQQIRRYEVASASEREQLQELIGPDGDKLIAGYQRRLREARQRFRILDPETDAWLNFFGTTTSLLSTEANQIYEELRKKYLVEAMIK